MNNSVKVEIKEIREISRNLEKQRIVMTKLSNMEDKKEVTKTLRKRGGRIKND